MSKPLCVCLDSNIYVSAIGFGGKPLAVVELALKKEFLVIISPHILNEVRKNLIHKIGIKGSAIDRFVENISEVAVFFTPTGSVAILHDSEDNKVIETALMGFANVLVTGDKAIAQLKSVGDLKVETTSTFLARFSKK
ncbi:MAG: putative toxin-antitoxin system toxin component, PIN family [Deltaproteobacteria bacterium]|nr:putative toxin-antitoxin system toxin component, PIN family [Deltaproteobacteria bacterium]